MSTTNVTPVQSQTPTTTNPQLAALQAQTAMLAQQQQQMDARLKIQQDQQSMLTGMLPTSTAAPQSGGFTVTGNNPFDSQKLAYEALLKAAEKVAAQVTGVGPVLIYDQTEINSLVNYKSVLRIVDALKTQVTHLKQTFDDDLGPEVTVLMTIPNPALPRPKRNIAAIVVPGLLLGGLKTLSDLMGMFRTNTSIAFSSFTADDVALTSAVVAALIAKNKERAVYEPAVMPLDVTNTTSTFLTEFSQVQNDLVDLQEKATDGQAKLQQMSDALGAFIQADQAVQANSDTTKAAGLDAGRLAAGQFAQGLFTTNPAVPAPAPLDGGTANSLKSQRDQFLTELGLFGISVSTMVTTFNALQTSLLAVTNTGSATLTAILRAEALMNKVTVDEATILLVKTSVLGGSVVTRVNLFTGGHLLFTGGAIVNYTLFDSSGKVTAAGLVAEEGEATERRF